MKGKCGNAFAESRKIESGHRRGFGQKAGLSHAWNGIDFKNVQAAVRGEKHIDAGVDFEPEGALGRKSGVLDGLGGFTADLGGNEVFRCPLGILVLDNRRILRGGRFR